MGVLIIPTILHKTMNKILIVIGIIAFVIVVVLVIMLVLVHLIGKLEVGQLVLGGVKQEP